MSDIRSWQQLLIVLSLTVVLCVPIGAAWQLFMYLLDNWRPRSQRPGFDGPRQRQRARRRRLKAVALAASLVVVMLSAAPAPPRVIPDEPDRGPNPGEIGYAVGVAVLSPDGGELKTYLEKWPEHGAEILEGAGIDPVEYCGKYPEYSYILDYASEGAVG